MKKLTSTISFIAWLFLGMVAMAQNKPSREEWRPLFNGKDLKGWDIKITKYELNQNFGNTYRVEDGILKIAYDQYDKFDNKFGHMYYHKPFSYYKLRVEYRFTGNQMAGGADWNVRNSGVMLHSQSAQSLFKDQEFPVSIEVQLLGGLGTGKRTTGNLCTPGTQVEMQGKVNPEHCINSSSKTYDGDQWVTVEAIVLGDSTVYHVVEGDTVLTYQKPQIGDGYVSDGIHWKKAEANDGAQWIKKYGTLLKEG
ncbi:MAG: DUF1080 domain-containing protein, partial [Bacteroidota bacterium]